LVMRGYFENSLGIEVPFFQWMIWAMPVMLVILVATYILLTFVIFPCHRFKLDRAEQVFAAERERLGASSGAQWRMLAVFATTALLWMSSGFLRPFLPELPLTGKPIPLTDEVIAIVAAIALFVIPGEQRDKRALLDWQSTTRLPWGILLLFGGGLSLAGGLEKTGVIQALSDVVQQMAGGQILLLLVLLVTLAIYLTEVMSNVALVQVLVPVVAAVALGLDLNPLYLAVPTTLASSCAFMLPMATPPNAIVFATGHVTVRQMIRAGFWLNAVSLLVIVLGAILLLPR
ncbi:MAG TPA: anion transporter, partial [Planctomycetaceae bacterium]|nr:anion transporter [Planctomycetaceae bacterium]